MLKSQSPFELFIKSLTPYQEFCKKSVALSPGLYTPRWTLLTFVIKDTSKGREDAIIDNYIIKDLVVKYPIIKNPIIEDPIIKFLLLSKILVLKILVLKILLNKGLIKENPIIVNVNLTYWFTSGYHASLQRKEFPLPGRLHHEEHLQGLSLLTFGFLLFFTFLFMLHFSCGLTVTLL